MKKFRFPLRSVATIRGIAELRAREQFSKTVQAFMAAEQQLQRIRERIREIETILLTNRGQIFRPAEEASFLAALKEETIRATKTEGEVAAARQQMEIARQAWLESRRDVRVIEKLEVKARQAHRHEVEREDQLALDDRTSGLVARAAKAS
jgi:flagellar export protein FliJ